METASSLELTQSEDNEALEAQMLSLPMIYPVLCTLKVKLLLLRKIFKLWNNII